MSKKRGEQLRNQRQANGYRTRSTRSDWRQNECEEQEKGMDFNHDLRKL